MEAESYGDSQLASFIEQNFVPIGVHIKENPSGFGRFESVWTPTVIILDENGKERYRIEGYLPKDDFSAQLLMGLARVAVMKKQWPDAEKLFQQVLDKYPNTPVAPAAVYWLGVSKYQRTHDHHALGNVVTELKQRYPDSAWNKRAIPWAA
ncbi:MAG TPA: tetratricopeptide repeat protein [Candidatus Angelobacter sp.]|nr:tetratricopeptide repeat protein [Candidatus Angelobacter sp.]